MSFSFDPADLTLITDPRDPLYDARVEDPIPLPAVLDAAARGIVTPIVVRRVGELSVVLDGIQRTKRALVVNALCGVSKYSGNVSAVMQAIIDIKAGQELEDSLARRVVALAPNGLKVPAVARNGGSLGDAYAVKTALNEFRHDDPIARKIQKAHRLAELGRTPDDIALDMGGVSHTTVKRWLARDPNEVKVRKLRGQAKRPGVPRIETISKSMVLPVPVMLAMRWVAGLETDQKILSQFPQLDGLLGG